MTSSRKGFLHGAARRVPLLARLGRCAASPARVLRAAAGLPGAVRRRGSVLVIVLGTLAMMSVLAVVFVTVGQSDRRASAAAQRQAKMDDVPEQVRDYVAGVIARDVLATFPSLESAKLNPLNPNSDTVIRYVHRRETWDYPSTDPAMLSVPEMRAQDSRRIDPMEPDLWRFRPEGDYPRLSELESDDQYGNPMDIDIPQRKASDPWLSPEAPTNLSPDDDIATGGVVGPPAIPGDTTPDWYNRRDWLNLSNFGPDGRAVNLFNLWPSGTFSISSYGFDAPSGVGSGTISDHLTLMDDELKPYPFSSGQFTIDGIEADPNVPAHWFSRQRGIAVAPTTGQPSVDWSSPAYLPYQFADADGDGILDSRWQELVDATIPGNLRNLLVTDGDMRYFFAFRAIDLSARVNVNVASDFTQAPSEEFPAGWTPADIDFRRLVGLEDARQEFRTQAGPTDPLPYFELPRDIQGDPDDESPQNYEAYDSVGNFGTTGNRVDIGGSSYDSVIASSTIGGGIPRHVTRNLLEDYLNSEYQVAFPSGAPQSWELNAKGRWERFQRASAASGGIAADPDVSNGNWRYRPANFFGDADLLELLTYNGCNDSTIRSTLESAIGGRFEDEPNLDPLRSNKLTSLERGDRDRFDAFPPIGSPKTQSDNDNDWEDTDADAYVHLATDIRMRLTTISGARAVYSSILESSKLSSSNPALRGTADRLDESKKAIADVVGDPYELFRLYRDSLVPHLAVQQVWDPASNPELRTLSYGFSGPELPIRIAAHMAANMADAVESDGIPTALAIAMNATGYTALTPATTVFTDQPLYPWLIEGGDDLKAEPSEDNLQFSPVPPSGSNAFIAFGIEPQPVITEVASYFVFADAPFIGAPDSNRDGDREWDVQPPGEPEASIRDGVTAQNPDFIFECIAIQISNPFQQSIALGDPASPYYIEFGGKFYSLSGLVLTEAAGKVEYPLADTLTGKRLPQSITLPPGESKTFYMFSQRLEDVQRKMDHADLHGKVIGGPARINVIGEFIQNNLAPNGDLANAVLIEEIPAIEAFPTPLATQVSMDSVAFFRDFFPPRNQPPQPITQVSLWRAHKVAADDFPTDPNRDNDRQNDQLVDRMRFPLDTQTGQIFSLDRRLDLDNTLVLGIKGYAIDGATAKNQTLDDNSNYNQGLTIFTYARVRRPNDGNLSADSVAMPMWAVEGRQDDWNIADKDPLGTRLDSFTSGDFSPTGSDNLFFRFSWRDATRPNFLDSVVLGTSNPVRNRISLHQDAADKSNDSRDTADPRANNLSGQTRNDVRIELHQGLDRRTMQVGDLLLPLGIGPEYHPETGEWITLSEALAMAMDYWRFSDSATTPAGLLPYETDPAAPGLAQQLPLDAQVPPAQVLGLPINHGSLDRGHLVIDDFVPFIDADPTDPPTRFDPRTEDVRVGLGLTPAMTILEKVRSRDSHVIAVWNFNDNNFQADRWMTRDENPSTNDEPRLQVTQGQVRQPSTWPAGETLGANLADPPGTQVQFAASATEETQIELQIPSRGWRNLYLSYAATTIPVTGASVTVYHQWQYHDGSAWKPLGGATPVPSAVGETYMLVDLSAVDGLDDRLGNSPARIRLTLMDGFGAFDGVGGTMKGVAECTIDNVVVSAAPINASTLVSATPGVVNLNTAGRMVLSTLPMVSPTLDQWPSYAVGAGNNVWWWPAAASGHAHDYRVDIAATLGAYRDKAYGVPRKRSINDLGDWAFTFDDQSGWGALFGGRASKNYITGVREDLGYVSQGELLGVALRNTPTGIPGGFNNTLRYSIDRLGRDLANSGGQANLDHDGLAPVQYTTTTSGDDGIPNDYDEKLAVANALFNTTSVRSDYFAVWFVMHGYQRSDVEGLPAGSPLVPSVARRFVMVVDRSNVTKPGDLPRVLFFKEVPM